MKDSEWTRPSAVITSHRRQDWSEDWESLESLRKCPATTGTGAGVANGGEQLTVRSSQIICLEKHLNQEPLLTRAPAELRHVLVIDVVTTNHSNNFLIC